MRRIRFGPALPKTPPFTVGDGVILLGLAALTWVGVRLAFHAPAVVEGPEISRSPAALPWYAMLSIGRMAVAYFLSLLFSLAYGYAAARNAGARRVLMPLLDVLQSVPILSFLPVVLLGLSAVMPQSTAAEIAAIVLIFTSQAWNMTFGFYQSMTTIPQELREAAAIYRLPAWLKFRFLELPFAALGLLWNSIMSWAGGWFFLMASEIFHVGARDFRLPGLGSYLQTAASAGDVRAVLFGVGALVAIIVLLDQLVWRPLLAWADRFKVEMVEGDEPPEAWFRDVVTRSWIFDRLEARVLAPLAERIDRRLAPPLGSDVDPLDAPAPGRRRATLAVRGLAAAVVLAGIYGGYRAVGLLAEVPAAAWGRIGTGLLATLARVAVALGFALVWTVPVGVAIGTSRRLAGVLQPIVQVLAAIPATALFPVILLVLLRAPFGLNLAAVLLMLMGTQWYLLFNVIAGAAAIPQDLEFTTRLLRLGTLQRWRTLVLPALFPYVVTGSITATGGAWNASIVAEYVEFGGATHETTGIGAVVAEATAHADYATLLAGTLVLVAAVVVINRVFWLRLYRVAESRFRME